jgi:biopolymer transport protein ExbD
MADGTRALDESGAYFVVLDESRIGELEQALRDFKSKTQQDAIYLEIQRDVDVRFI